MPPLERHASNFFAPLSTPVSLKRRRINSVLEGTKTLPIDLKARHKDLWYDDGNIVIVTDTMLFRVHRSILSRYAIVFSDMFSIPQPPNQDLIHGCPFVQLFDDAKDVATMLSTLYDTRLLVAPSVEFDVVSTWLRLGSKYGISCIRDEAIVRLDACYPYSLASFWNSQILTYTKKPRPIVHSDGEEYFVYRLAWTHDLRHIVAVALYKCCQHSIASLKNVVHLTCGPLDLDRDFLLHYTEGREKLLDNKLTWSLGFLNSDVTRNCAKEGCETAKIGMIVEMHQSGMMRHPDALTDHSRMINRSGFCPDCTSKLEELHMEDLRGVWDDLERCFGFLQTGRSADEDDD